MSKSWQVRVSRAVQLVLVCRRLLSINMCKMHTLRTKLCTSISNYLKVLLPLRLFFFFQVMDMSGRMAKKPIGLLFKNTFDFDCNILPGRWAKECITFRMHINTDMMWSCLTQICREFIGNRWLKEFWKADFIYQVKCMHLHFTNNHTFGKTAVVKTARLVFTEIVSDQII